MQSVSQQPTKGQAVSPPPLIDGVSQQQIDAAVKAHVSKARSKAPADPERIAERLNKAESDLQTAIDELHIARDILYQQAVLLRKCREELGRPIPSLSDVRALVDLGEREGEGWTGSVENVLAELGEKVPA